MARSQNYAGIMLGAGVLAVAAYLIYRKFKGSETNWLCRNLGINCPPEEAAEMTPAQEAITRIIEVPRTVTERIETFKIVYPEVTTEAEKQITRPSVPGMMPMDMLVAFVKDMIGLKKIQVKPDIMVVPTHQECLKEIEAESESQLMSYLSTRARREGDEGLYNWFNFWLTKISPGCAAPLTTWYDQALQEAGF